MNSVKTKEQATILIVEDDESLRNGLRDVLRSNQFFTIEAKDGKEAVELALASRPDLILLDLMLPIMGGMTALKNIREVPWGQQVPVIMLTNLNATDSKLVGEMVAQSPSYYLVKSDWKIHDIVAKVKEVLKNR